MPSFGEKLSIHLAQIMQNIFYYILPKVVTGVAVHNHQHGRISCKSVH